MNKIIRLTTLTFVALLLSNTVKAVPINYVETIDFGNYNTAGAYLGSFDLGINTVSGYVQRDSEAEVGAGDYGDFWEASLSAGQQITSISISISNQSGEEGFFVGAADNIVGGYGPFGAQAYANLVGDGNYSLSATGGTSYPFAAGDYYFGAATNVGTNTGYAYEWQVVVEGVEQPGEDIVVPEPSTLALMGLGLLGIGICCKRKPVRQ